jgi:hypothetical protein
VTSTATVATPEASIDLEQLRRHLGHETATADDAEGRARVERVVGSHLERFAHREELVVSWP